MNFTIFGPFFGNKLHGAEQGVYSGLKELGHNVSVYDYRTGEYLSSEGIKIKISDKNILLEVIKNDATDIVLCLGPGLPDEVVESDIWKKYKLCIKVLWTSEPIRLIEYKAKMIKQKGRFNYIFTFDQSEIPIYKEIGIDAAWAPQGYNPAWYNPLWLPNNQRFNDSFIFVGSVGGKWNNRHYFLNRVKDFGFKINAATIFDATRVNRAYNMHLAVLNLGLYIPESGPVEDLKAYGLQQRIYESYGAGQVCITNEIPKDTNKLFEHGKDILFYNKDNLKETLEMAMDKKLITQMKKNIENNRNKHCYKSRLEKIISMIEW